MNQSFREVYTWQADPGHYSFHYHILLLPDWEQFCFNFTVLLSLFLTQEILLSRIHLHGLRERKSKFAMDATDPFDLSHKPWLHKWYLQHRLT